MTFKDKQKRIQDSQDECEAWLQNSHRLDPVTFLATSVHGNFAAVITDRHRRICTPTSTLYL